MSDDRTEMEKEADMPPVSPEEGARIQEVEALEYGKVEPMPRDEITREGRYARDDALQEVPKSLVVSCPHTGTRTLCKMTGLKHRHTNGFMTNMTPYSTRILVPVRTPHSVIRSWASRYAHRAGTREEDLIPKHLMSLDVIRRKYPYVYFVPVDREKRAREILEELGFRQPKKWDNVGRHRDYKKEPPVFNEKHLDLMVWFTKYDWWMQFYPELYGYGRPGFEAWPGV